MLRFNFAELRESKFEKYVRTDIIFLVFVLAGAFAADYFAELSLNRKIDQLNRKIAQLRSEEARLKRVRREVSRLEKLRKELQHRLSVVAQLEKGRQVPGYLYFHGDPKNVRGVWLTELASKNKLLKIKGGTFKVKNLPSFIGKIENHLGKVIFRDVKREVYVNNGLGLDIKYYKFNFKVELKNGTTQ